MSVYHTPSNIFNKQMVFTYNQRYITPMFGIYVHWPYCLSKCPYCDFNSHVTNHVDHNLWRECYALEMKYIAEKTPDHVVTSIYFGGGTPSLMQPQTVEFVLDEIQKNWRLSNAPEITLEANPTSIEQEKFSAFYQAGINRVSVGVQALDDKDLKFLGRQHSVRDAKAALDIAYRTFDRVSFDLIYARPQQSVAAWEKELNEALGMAKAGHLSLYQLTIEPGTAFETMYKRKEFSIPDDDLGGELYELTASVTKDHGYKQYEISNYAKAGEESRHNLTYWGYEDYAGIGPGAHGRLTINDEKFATRTHRAPQIWQERVKTSGHGYHAFEQVSKTDRVIECLLMGLRTERGVTFEKLAQESAHDWKKVLNEKKVVELISAGYISLTPDRLSLTQAGRQRLNKILEEIII